MKVKTMKDEFQGMSVADAFESITREHWQFEKASITHEKWIDNLNNSQDLLFWGMAFFLSKGVVSTDTEAVHMLWDIKIGDIWTRTKEQNRELFNLLANDKIKRMEWKSNNLTF